MQMPILGPEQSGEENKVPRPSRNQAKKQKYSNIKSNTRKTHITVTYSRGLSESFKNTCKKYGSKYISEEAGQSKTSWWHPKIKNISPRRVASSTGLSVIGWNVMKNILVNQPEPLVKGLKST